MVLPTSASMSGITVASKTKAIKPTDLNRIIVDTTVQPKNVMFPTDARLLNRARETWSGWQSGRASRYANPMHGWASSR